MKAPRKDLTPAQRNALRGRAARVWAAVYASEWTQAFTFCAERNGFDHEDDFDHAERAATMADRAVYQMHDFESENG